MLRTTRGAQVTRVRSWNPHASRLATVFPPLHDVIGHVAVAAPPPSPVDLWSQLEKLSLSLSDTHHQRAGCHEIIRHQRRLLSSLIKAVSSKVATMVTVRKQFHSECGRLENLLCVSYRESSGSSWMRAIQLSLFHSVPSCRCTADWCWCCCCRRRPSASRRTTPLKASRKTSSSTWSGRRNTSLLRSVSFLFRCLNQHKITQTATCFIAVLALRSYTLSPSSQPHVSPQYFKWFSNLLKKQICHWRVLKFYNFCVKYTMFFGRII